MTMQLKRRGILLLLSVFLLGMICGAALLVVGKQCVSVDPCDGLSGCGPNLDWFAGEFGLDAQQKTQVQVILETHREEMITSFERIREEIQAVLDEEQQKKFDEMKPHFLKPAGGCCPASRRIGPDRGVSGCGSPKVETVGKSTS